MFVQEEGQVETSFQGYPRSDPCRGIMQQQQQQEEVDLITIQGLSRNIQHNEDDDDDGDDEEDDEDEEEEEEEEGGEEEEGEGRGGGNSSDEGYRTHSASSSSSPYSATADSPSESSSPESSSNKIKRGKNSEKPKETEEGGNLMWLLDFKLDFFNDQDNNLKDRKIVNEDEATMTAMTTEETESTTSPLTSTLATEETLTTSEESTNDMPKDFDKRFRKPPYTYTELITQALKDKTALTVSGIYQWITDRFLFFKAEDDRWKNSVRHNLSMNPHFRKGSKSKHGAGHLWVLADYSDDNNDSDDPMKDSIKEDEAARAVRSILDSEEQKLARGDSSMDKVRTSEILSTNVITRDNHRKRKLSATPQTISYTTEELHPPPTDGQEVFIATNQTEKRIFLELNTADHSLHDQSHHQHLLPSSVASNVEVTTNVPFSPMEDMEELGVVSGYCYDEDDVQSLENALGLDFQQRQLLAK